MAHRKLIAALGLMVAAAAAPATTPDSDLMAAPPGTPATRYCMRIEPLSDSRIEQIRCWTRAEWAEQGVDVDRDWAKEGVRVEG